MATEIYRQNIISQIQDSDGRMVSDHMEKSSPFWQEFCNRIGVLEDTHMLF